MSESLLDLFALERLDATTFRAPNPEAFSFGRMFGGQVVAQALRAAQLTVEVDHQTHSLHSYFVRGGKPGLPIRLEVEITRNGRSFTTRQVEAIQGDEVIFCLSCSFHRTEDGPEYQLPMAQDVPSPDQPHAGFGHMHGGWRTSLDMRELGPSAPDERGVYASTRRTWMRVGERLPDDLAVHQCVIAFMSDMGASMGARVPHLMDEPHMWGGASLDHALWFHRPARADEWLLFDLHAVSNSGARGFTRGTMHTREGVLAVSVTQETLMRPTGRVFG